MRLGLFLFVLLVPIKNNHCFAMMGGAIAKPDLGIAFRNRGSAIAKRCCKQFDVWGCGNAIAKRDLGIAFGDVEEVR